MITMPLNPDQLPKDELLKAYCELAAYTERFQIIAENAPVMLWMTDGAGKSQFTNKKWLKFTGCSDYNDSSSVWVNALHPAERQSCLASFQAAFKAQLPFQMEYQLRRHDGEYRWILDIGEPLYHQDGGFAGYIGSSQDISERKHAEKALQCSFVELKRHDRENTLLSEMNGYMQVCRGTEELYSVISFYAKQLFSDHSGLISLINASRSLVDTIVEWGDSHESETLFSLEDCWSLRQGKRHSVDDPQNGLLCRHLKSEASQPYLCLPMSAYGETLGILHLQLPHKADDNEDSGNTVESTIRLASTFANQSTLAIANLKLREALQHQSVRDPLTQLYNRRYLLESMERELARARRHQLSIGIIIIDVDHFKRYNDTYGHDAGDALLREFGNFLKNQCRGEDIPCRYGGEEFVMVMPGINEENLLHRCNEIREKAKLLDIELRGQKLGKITISVGAVLFPIHGETADNLISAADAAMYIAKHNGRDRVIMHKATETLVESS
jgi:diguanylate cyclase (GGDEF)-like protein/PAS domain S-box-containing protein